MPDARVLARIDAWASAGLIDEVTADRLRSAEADADAAAEAGRDRPRSGGLGTTASSLFGPGITVGEMFAYLGGGFLLAAWFTLVGRLASESVGRDPVWALGALAAAGVLAVMGGRLRRGTSRLRRAAGVTFVASAASFGAGAYAVVDALANGAGRFDAPVGGAPAQLAGAAVWLVFALAYRRLHPALLTQAGLVLAVIGLAGAIMGWLEPILFGVPSFDAPPIPDNPARVVLIGVGWGIAAVVLGLIGLGEARSEAPGSPARAALTRFAAGMTAVLGTASAVFASGYVGNDEYGRLIPPVVGAAVLVVVSGVLLERAFRRDASAFVYPAALGVIIGLSDLNATYLATATSTELALLVEGVILLGAGVGFDRARRLVAKTDGSGPGAEADDAGRRVDATGDHVEVTSTVGPS